MNDSAVSPVIGFILILLITVTFIGIVQSVMLPEWNKAYEIEHSDTLSYEVARLGEAVTFAATSGKNNMIALHAGMRYPDRPFLFSPTFASATISSQELNISVKSDKISFTDKTHAILIKPNYYYSSSPEFVFEHTASFKSYEFPLVISGQSMFQKSSVSVYILNTTFTNLAVTQPVSIMLEPVSYGGKVFVEDAWINFTSLNPDYWEDTIGNISPDWVVIRNGNNISVNVKNVYLSVSYLVAQASTGGTAEVNVTVQPYDIWKYFENASMTVGESRDFYAKVVDVYGNPVPNVYVEFDASGGTIDRQNSTTEDNGQVSVGFTAVTATSSAYVRFTCPSCTNTTSVQYPITITEPESSAPYTINWEKEEYVVAGTEGEITQVEMRANTTPKAVLATVEFTTDNQYATFNPRQTTTDSEGNATTTLSINPQPDWGWLTTIRAYATTLASGDTAIVKFYLTKIWRVDIYEDFINGLFENTQLIGSSGEDSQVILAQSTGNWLAGWSYRMNVTVSSTTDVTDYQVLINADTASLISAGKMKTDCSDIRFTQSDGTTKLNYWIESGCNSGNTRIWVKTNLQTGDNTIYMYYGNSIASSESSLSNTFDVVGEAGVVSVGGSEVTVNFANSYLNPAVFAVPRLDAGVYRSGEVSAQHHLITEVTASYFRIKQVESPSGGDGIIDTTQVSYIVLEKGIYYIGTGLLAEVGEIIGKGTYSTFNLQTSFASQPAILADIQESATQGALTFEDAYTRIDLPGISSFDLQVERDDDTRPPASLQATTVYIALEQERDSLNELEAKKTTDSITDTFTSIAYSQSYSSSPVVIAQLDSEDGGNSCYAVTRDVTAASFELACEEPAIEDGPHTTEEFSWISVPEGTIYGRKYLQNEPAVAFGAEETVQYQTPGNYTSIVKDLTSNSTIKNFLWDGNAGGSTNIDFYIRASNTSFNISDPSPPWIYIGDSGSTSYDLSSLNITGRYVQWRAVLTTSDTTKTPVLDEVTVGYQPVT
jgi:hypothetical protein